MVMAVLVFTPVAHADQFTDQITELNSQLKAQQQQASVLKSQANTLANRLAAINAQVAAINAQIRLTQAKYDKAIADIEEANQQLKLKKAILGENIRQIYQQSSITPLEVLASSKNFSDFFDKQQYLDRIKDHIQEAANAIVALKAQLEKDKADAEVLLQQQNDLKVSLRQQQAEAAQLLADTQGQEAAYQAQVAKTQAQLNAIIAARAAAVRSGNLQITAGGCGGYPAMWCNAAQDSLVDDWRYYNRECVSYVAWKRYATGGYVPYAWGNAYQWYSHVNSSTPHAGDIAVWGQYANAWTGYFGHVAYVESVDGGGVRISQYNFDVGNGPGRYSEMYIPYGSTMWGGIGFVH